MNGLRVGACIRIEGCSNVDEKNKEEGMTENDACIEGRERIGGKQRDWQTMKVGGTKRECLHACTCEIISRNVGDTRRIQCAI